MGELVLQGYWSTPVADEIVPLWNRWKPNASGIPRCRGPCQFGVDSQEQGARSDGVNPFQARIPKRDDLSRSRLAKDSVSRHSKAGRSLMLQVRQLFLPPSALSRARRVRYPVGSISATEGAITPTRRSPWADACPAGRQLHWQFFRLAVHVSWSLFDQSEGRPKRDIAKSVTL